MTRSISLHDNSCTSAHDSLPVVPQQTGPDSAARCRSRSRFGRDSVSVPFRTLPAGPVSASHSPRPPSARREPLASLRRAGEGDPPADARVTSRRQVAVTSRGSARR